MNELPKPGQLVVVDKAASVQFMVPLLFRVISVDDNTYQGWAWLHGYQTDARGNAIEKRDLFVQVAGLIEAGPVPAPSARNQRQPEPARVPRPRQGTHDTARSPR